jgi:hypothetical protein
MKDRESAAFTGFDETEDGAEHRLSGKCPWQEFQL